MVPEAAWECMKRRHPGLPTEQNLSVQDFQLRTVQLEKLPLQPRTLLVDLLNQERPDRQDAHDAPAQATVLADCVAL